MKVPPFLKVAVYASLTENNTYDRDNRFYRTGVEMTKLLSKALKFKYKLLPSVDGEFGQVLDDGNWTGMIGMVHRGEVDMAVSEIGITEMRSQVVQYSYPFDIIDVTFITHRPYSSSDLTTVLEPLSFEIWIVFVLFHIFIPAALYFVFHRRYSFQMVALKTVGTFYGQPVFDRPRRPAAAILVITWMIGMMFLSHIYKANLLSTLTFPTLHGVGYISELSDAVKRGTYRCVSYPGSFYVDYLKLSSDESIRIVGRDLLKNIGSSDIEWVLQTPNRKKSAFIGPKTEFMHLGYKFFISEDVFFLEIPAIAMRKDFCCKNEFDEAILYMNAGGLRKKILEDETFNLILSDLDELAYAKVETVTPLTLLNLHGAFVLLCAGYASSILVFLLEVYGGKTRKKEQNGSTVHSLEQKGMRR